MRMKFFRILPAMWQITSWPLSSRTRNWVFASACVTLPCTKIASSLAMSSLEINGSDQKTHHRGTEDTKVHKGTPERSLCESLCPLCLCGAVLLHRHARLLPLQRLPLFARQGQQGLARIRELLQ